MLYVLAQDQGPKSGLNIKTDIQTYVLTNMSRGPINMLLIAYFIYLSYAWSHFIHNMICIGSVWLKSDSGSTGEYVSYKGLDLSLNPGWEEFGFPGFLLQITCQYIRRFHKLFLLRRDLAEFKQPTTKSNCLFLRMGCAWSANPSHTPYEYFAHL